MTPTDDEMRAIAAGMKRAGLTNRAIAERIGISLRAAKALCASLGAKRRLDGKGGTYHSSECGRMLAHATRFAHFGDGND
jgi:hypothetical protein